MSFAATAWGLSPGYVPRGRRVRCRRLSLDAWILALHLLAAFAFVAAVAGYWGMIAAGWNASLPREVLAIFRLNPFFQVLVGLGAAGTIVFGLWLAISLDAYQLWDGWVIAALVLWAIGGFVGQQSGQGYQAGGELAEKLAAEGTTSSPELAEIFGTSRAFWFHIATGVVVVLILVDMIWKPGA